MAAVTCYDGDAVMMLIIVLFTDSISMMRNAFAGREKKAIQCIFYHVFRSSVRKPTHRVVVLLSLFTQENGFFFFFCANFTLLENYRRTLIGREACTRSPWSLLRTTHPRYCIYSVHLKCRPTIGGRVPNYGVEYLLSPGLTRSIECHAPKATLQEY